MSPLTEVLVVLVLASAVALLGAPWAAAAHPPAVRGTGGAVASAEPLATGVGLAVLADGGNAVDAAVAMALALAVTYPEAGNLGGGGFAVLRMVTPEGEVGGGPQTFSLDFRETAPAAAHRHMYLDAEGEADPDRSRIGALAVGVPGSPAGLWELHQGYGSLPWKRLVEPARRLAADGFPVSAHLAARLEEERELLARFPETAAVWLPGGEPLAAGHHLRLPDLAATLAAYAERGPEAVTTGAVAAAVEAVVAKHDGVLTGDDLSEYRAVWRKPLEFEAFGWSFAGMDLPSSGAILTAETLGLLERAGWAGLPRFGAERAHLLAEAWRRAFADRFLLADPATTDATAEALLAPARLDDLARSLGKGEATDSGRVRPGAGLPGHELKAADAAQAAGEPDDTTHLSVVDADGNLVALTTTLNGLFGSGLYVPGAGFFLNNEMDDFTAAPGVPNLYGLVQGEANAVRPGRRMLSSMSPTVAWRGGVDGNGGEAGWEAVALGGRGGSRIITAVVQVLLAHLADGDPLQAALDRPRIHHQWLPDVLRHEPDALSPETRAALAARGHELEEYAAVAKVHAVARRADGTVEAAVDPREDGRAGVVTPAPP